LVSPFHTEIDFQLHFDVNVASGATGCRQELHVAAFLLAHS
jgi:hypothetical protein